MFLRKTIAVLATTAALSTGLLVGTAQAAVTLTYNASAVTTKALNDAVHAGAKVWNDNVANVRLVPTNGTANSIIAITVRGATSLRVLPALRIRVGIGGLRVSGTSWSAPPRAAYTAGQYSG